jgi:hypothetical protein
MHNQVVAAEMRPSLSFNPPASGETLPNRDADLEENIVFSSKLPD